VLFAVAELLVMYLRRCLARKDGAQVRDDVFKVLTKGAMVHIDDYG